jgi:hypothetical protein
MTRAGGSNVESVKVVALSFTSNAGLPRRTMVSRTIRLSAMSSRPATGLSSTVLINLFAQCGKKLRVHPPLPFEPLAVAADAALGLVRCHRRNASFGDEGGEL